MSRSNAWTWSITLLVTCLFGIGIGLSLGYALFTSRDESAPESVASLPLAEPLVTEPTSDPPPQNETPTPVPEMSPVDVEAEAEPVLETPVAQEEPIWAARHLFVAVNGQWLADGTKTFLRELKPGGVILRGNNLQSPSQTLALVADIKKSTGLGEGLGDLPLIGIQHEGGSFNHLGLDEAPSAQELGRANDRARTRALGEGYGRASIDRGIGVAFSPVLDVYETGTVDPGLESRTFGSNQTIVANLGLAMAEGLRAGGAIPVVKHFPGYGAATYGPDGVLVVLNKDFSGLAKVMYPFNEAVRTGIQGVMVGFVAVPALDKDNPRRPAALSPILVKELLRTRWGFDGVIVADDVAANATALSRPIAEIAVESLAAGCDAILLLDANPRRIRAVVEAIEQAVEAGTLSREELNRSKARLEEWQTILGNTRRVSPVEQAKVETPLVQVPRRRLGDSERIPRPSEVKNDRTDEPVILQTEPIVFLPKLSEEGEESPPITEESAPAAIEVEVKDERAVVAPEPEAEIARNDALATDEPSLLAAPESSSESTVVEEDGHAEEESDPADEDQAIPVAGVRVEELEDSTPAEEDSGELTAEEATPDANLRAVANKILHAVVEDDTLPELALKYGVAASDIVLWNGLESEELEVGQELTVFVDSDADAVAPDEVAPVSAEPTTPIEEYGQHIVQLGDTVSKIARAYDTTVEIVLELNSLSDPNHVWVGQKLRVPKR